MKKLIIIIIFIFTSVNIFGVTDLNIVKYSKHDSYIRNEHSPHFKYTKNGINLIFYKTSHIKKLIFTQENGNIVEFNKVKKIINRSYYIYYPYDPYGMQYNELPGNLKHEQRYNIIKLNKKTIDLLKTSKIVKMKIIENFYGNYHEYDYDLEFEMEGIINLLEIFKEDE